MGTKRNFVIRWMGHARRVKVVDCVNKAHEVFRWITCNDGLGINWVIEDGPMNLPGMDDVP